MATHFDPVLSSEQGPRFVDHPLFRGSANAAAERSLFARTVPYGILGSFLLALSDVTVKSFRCLTNARPNDALLEMPEEVFSSSGLT